MRGSRKRGRPVASGHRRSKRASKLRSAKRQLRIKGEPRPNPNVLARWEDEALPPMGPDDVDRAVKEA